MKQAIIVGGGAKPRCFPFDLAEREAEIWCINFQKKDWLPRVDVMFNLHRYALLKKYGWPCYADGMWARDHKATEVVLLDKWPDERMHKASIFPREAIANALPGARNDYHCNSLDWLIAYALYLDLDAVHIQGFNLEREGIVEQQSAAKCAEYWAGYAEASGTKIVVGADSSLFGIYHMVKSNRLYGYDDCPAWEDRTPDGKDPPYRYDDY